MKNEMRLQENDTISAISTPMGCGGIGIIRISGPRAVEVADKVFRSPDKGRPSEYLTHTIHYGFVYDPSSDQDIDEVLLTVMRAPRTYTREDVVEINCHGGYMSLQKVLSLCVMAGARLAEPGEFTRRAFMNGRIDLTRAEAVMDMINAGTVKARKLAMEQLSGGLSAKVEELRTNIVDVLALIELSLDFCDEDVEMPSLSDIDLRVKDIFERLQELSRTASGGMIVREGAGVVICGKPNVGKSSLMNALLRHERVIVAPVSGTTRDVVEECVDIDGIKVRLSDTAGIGNPLDSIEIEGIRRSKEKLVSADIIIFMVDVSEKITEQDMAVYREIENKKVIVVLNKTDKGVAVKKHQVSRIFEGKDIVMVSALKGRGLKELERSMSRHLFSDIVPAGEDAVITRIRHLECVNKAKRALSEAIDIFSLQSNAELMAVGLKDAVHYLGLITGKAVEEDILDRIFSEFCIGK